MKKLDIDDFYLMRAIAQEASLSAVASRLGIVGSAVSRRIKKIEKIIGGSLIQRRGTTIQLTEIGEMFLEMSTDMLRRYDRFQVEAGKMSKGKDMIRVIGNGAIMISDLPGIVRQVSIQHPEVTFDFRTGSIRAIFKTVLNDKADIGLVPDSPHVDGLIFHRYRKERLCVISPASHPLSDLQSVSLAKLAKYRLIGIAEDRFVWTLVAKAAKRLDVQIDYLMSINDYDLQANMAALTELAPAIVFESVARRICMASSAKIITLDEDWAERYLYICLQNAQKLPEPVSDFVDAILSAYTK